MDILSVDAVLVGVSMSCETRSKCLLSRS